MKPTTEQLNKWCAEALGWKHDMPEYIPIAEQWYPSDHKEVAYNLTYLFIQAMKPQGYLDWKNK